MGEDTGIVTGLNRRFAEPQAAVRETMAGVSGRGELTVEQILAWADAHHAAHGAWPEVGLLSGFGAVDGIPEESWKAINHALALGLRGLPGDSSLAEVLAEHRGTAPPDMGAEALAKKIWAWEQEQFPLKGPRRQMRVQEGDPPLTIDTILAWADAHHAATGAWPRVDSGPVRGAPFELKWRGVNAALYLGLRGLPGGSSLPRLLGEYRQVRYVAPKPPLTLDQVLAWADAHRAATGRWPFASKAPVAGAPGETWSNIDSGLRDGRRGLPGGLTLARVLAQHRGHRERLNPPQLTLDQILAWADAYHAAHGRWPTIESGPIADVPGETWCTINGALQDGRRGLCAGQSLVQVLVQHRGMRNRAALPRLTIDQILGWADAHHAAHGRWPASHSGPVTDAPGETWNTIDLALTNGRRGICGGTSLARLLAQHRGHRTRASLPRLTPERILAWADAHHAADGRWPTAKSGPVTAAAGETWGAIDAALTVGNRGLCGSTSLARLLVQHRGHRRGTGRSCLTVDQILAWADAHHAAHGCWPAARSGPVTAAAGEIWSAIDGALTKGYRGLCGGTSLVRLLVQHRRHRSGRARPCLTVDEILAWADAHRAAHGRWPAAGSGPVTAAAGETWGAIDIALTKGYRGLCGGTSLARLLVAHRQSRG